MWVLVLIWVGYNAGSITTVPFKYNTYDECVAAGTKWNTADSGLLKSRGYQCLPVSP